MGDSQRIYERLFSLSKHSPFILFSHITESNFVERSFLSRLKVIFKCLEFSRGTTIAAKIGLSVADLKLEVK